MASVSWVFAVLLALAVLVLIGAEWSRISARTGSLRPRERQRARRKASWTVLDGDDESDEFAASVQRDLSRLPTIEERDRRTR
jgi:hypothetical protein